MAKDGEGTANGKTGKSDDAGGYCKPPKHSQWPKGTSGNPRGPKKGSRGLKKDLHKALNAKRSIKVNGEVVTGTTQELAMMTLATRAATGDVRAIKQLVELTLQIFGSEDRGRERNTISALDQELLARLLGKVDPDGEDDDETGEEGAPEEGPKGNPGQRESDDDDTDEDADDGEEADET